MLLITHTEIDGDTKVERLESLLTREYRRPEGQVEETKHDLDNLQNFVALLVEELYLKNVIDKKFITDLLHRFDRIEVTEIT